MNPTDIAAFSLSVPPRARADIAAGIILAGLVLVLFCGGVFLLYATVRGDPARPGIWLMVGTGAFLALWIVIGRMLL